MARVYTIPLHDRESWQTALADTAHGVAHTWSHCHAMHLTTGHPTYLFCHEDGSGRTVCAVSERNWKGTTDVVTPFGFAGFSRGGNISAAIDCWRRHAQARGYICGYFALGPTPAGYEDFKSVELVSHNALYLLDLTGSEHEMLARLHPSRRRYLRRWQDLQKMLVFERGPLEIFFKDHYHSFLRAKHASEVYDLSGETLDFLLTEGGLYLVGAGQGGRIEAVAAFGHTPHGADYLFGISLDGGRAFSAALLWQAAQHFKGLGIPHLNLGGGIQEGDGVAIFKASFGAMRLPLWSLRQIYNQDGFEQLCRNEGLHPGRQGYFPPYHKPGRMAEPSSPHSTTSLQPSA